MAPYHNQVKTTRSQIVYDSKYYKNNAFFCRLIDLGELGPYIHI